MAFYPVTQGGKGSRIDVDPDAGIQKTRMADGTERGFTDYPDDQFTLTIEHWWLEQADADAIKAFYDADKTGVHSVVTELEGTYDCTFSNRPKVTEKSGNLSKVVSIMTGAKV